MEDWKIRQRLSHQLLPLTDEISHFEMVKLTDRDEILQAAVDYFFVQQDKLYYPSKSYCVAIIYARLLTQHFNADFYHSLNDPQLLYDNDPYFVPYNEDRDTYDAILARIPEELDTSLFQVQKTVEYFNKEFLLDEYAHLLV